MPDTWANSGLDLHLDHAGPRLRAGLEEALRDAVRTGRLAPGLLLPSSRTLAADLGIARNTVADAYSQLTAEGWLTARQGSGTRVASRVRSATAAPAAVEAARPPRYDLRPGSPDVSAFPRSAWLAATRRALTTAPAEALGYTDPRGRPELREALAGYLARARGLQVTPDRVVICSGFTQGFALICQVIRKRGATTLAVEAYGQAAHRNVAAASGLAIATVPVDDQGAVVSELGDAGAVLLTPAHQFPIGAALVPQRRSDIVSWAAAGGGLVIEDDYDGEFRYDRQPLGAVQALAPEQVVYCGTASKSLAPGLRLGWLVLPAALTDEVIAAKALIDRNTSSIDQLTLAEFITSGGYDRQIRRSRLTYRRRRDRLVAALRQQVPAARVTGITAGLHLLLELPADQTEDDIIARAAARGLALEGLGPYTATSDPHPPALVVGYGTPPDHAFTGAVARLTATLAETR
jgi:GntR family transcriptional regulator / MocR family aminotransferase